MSDVFDEISDDLRREQLKGFWRENGAWIIGGAVAAVLLTAALSVWRHWDYRRDAMATMELNRLVAMANVTGLETFSKVGDRNHALIAGFVAAGMHLKQGEKDKAVAIYDDIAKTFGVDKTWRDLAKILSISQRLDAGDPASLEKELAALSGDGAPWRYTARELEALLAARQNHMQKAVDALTKITADPEAPVDARTRAFTLRELYMADVEPKT